MMVTGVGVVLVIGGPPLIAAFAPLAVNDAEPSSERSRGFGRQYGAHLVISLPITGLALAAWSVGAWFGGVDVPDAVVAVLLLGLGTIAALFAAWTAFAAAQLTPSANTVAVPH